MIPDPAWTDQDLVFNAVEAAELNAAWFYPLSTVDSSRLSPLDRVRWTVAQRRMVAIAEELFLRALGSVQVESCLPPGEQPWPTDGEAGWRCQGGVECQHRWHGSHLAFELHQTEAWVNARRDLADELAGPLAPLRELLAAGRTSVDHVRAAARQLGDLPAGTVREILAKTLHRASQTSPERYRDSVHAQVLRQQSPEDAVARAAAARRRNTGIRRSDLDDGLAALTVTGPVEQISALEKLLRTHPDVLDRVDGDARTAGQRQVDLLVDVIRDSFLVAASRPRGKVSGHATVEMTGPANSGTTGYATVVDLTTGEVLDGVTASWQPPPSCPTCGHVAGEVELGLVVTASAETLTGQSNSPGTFHGQHLHAALTRELAAQATWFRTAIVDGKGVITDLGRRSRLARGGQRIAVRLKAPTCIWPCCPRQADRCEIDHARPWALGGRTDLDNEWPLCKRHNLLKEQLGWTLTPNVDGTATWRDPSGNTVTVHPTDHRPEAGPHDLVGMFTITEYRDYLKLLAPPEENGFAQWDGSLYDDWGNPTGQAATG